MNDNKHLPLLPDDARPSRWLTLATLVVATLVVCVAGYGLAVAAWLVWMRLKEVWP